MNATTDDPVSTVTSHLRHSLSVVLLGYAGLTSLLLFASNPCFASSPTTDLVHFLRTPDGGLQPQAAVEPDGAVHLVYLKGDPAGCDVFYTRRPPGQTNFSPPIRVNSEPGSAIALGTVRGAQLAIGRQGRVHVAWNGAQPARDPGAKGTPMLYSRLDDSRRKFEPQRNLMTATMNLDGGGSVAADTLGNVYVIWHAHPRGDAEDETHRHVYIASSRDDGKTFAPERPADTGGTGTCGCCGLKAFADERGQLAVLYRSADNLGDRDITLLLSSDQGKTFQSRVLGPWRVTTCPMSTEDLGAGPGGGLLALWETKGQIFREFIPPQHLSSQTIGGSQQPPSCKHPRFAYSPDRHHLFLVWVEDTAWAKGGSVAWECNDLATGMKTVGRESGLPAWDFAAVIPERDGSFTLIY